MKILKENFLLIIILLTAFVFTLGYVKNKQTIGEVQNNRVKEPTYSKEEINNLEFSTDTIFLGFTMGMSRQEYKSHIAKLRKEGISIDYETMTEKNRLKYNETMSMNYKYKSCYVANIAVETNVTGRYILFPHYKENQLRKLVIGRTSEDNDFLTDNLKEKYKKDKALENFLDTGYLTLRRNGNVVYYNNLSGGHFLEDLRTIITNHIINEAVDEVLEEKNKKIVF